jgi:hypothetical protein
MFLPRPLVENEAPLSSEQDVLNALRKWVLPKYDSVLHFNVGYIKSECLGILKSYHDFHRLHKSLTYSIIEKLVLQFMEEDLLVPPNRLRDVAVMPHLMENRWRKCS